MSNSGFLNQDLEPKKSRPKFLLVLVVLSTINIVFSTIGTLGAVFGVKPDQQLIDKLEKDFATMREQFSAIGGDQFIGLINQMEEMAMNLFDHFQSYNTLQLLFLILGLYGVRLMYLAKRLGFHFYILYCLGLLLMPYLFNPFSTVPVIFTIFGILYSGLWVFLYSRNLHWMKD